MGPKKQKPETESVIKVIGKKETRDVRPPRVEKEGRAKRGTDKKESSNPKREEMFELLGIQPSMVPENVFGTSVTEINNIIKAVERIPSMKPIFREAIEKIGGQLKTYLFRLGSTFAACGHGGVVACTGMAECWLVPFDNA